MLKVKKIVLYRHGLGCFEREGEVDGKEAVELYFTEKEMNDVLKSLTVFDHSGGKITNVSYRSSGSSENGKQPKTINGITDILKRAKGTTVTIETEQEKLTGKIAGLEKFRTRGGETFLLSLITDDSTVRSISLFDLTKVSFPDKNLMNDTDYDLKRPEMGSAGMRKVSIFPEGEDRRKITASYIKETPVWKVSYRIVLEDSEHTIQGWAIVDNNTGEDWKNVNLTLASGIPISFAIDLYSSRSGSRSVVKLEHDKPIPPPEYEDTADDSEMMFNLDYPVPQPEIDSGEIKESGVMKFRKGKGHYRKGHMSRGVPHHREGTASDSHITRKITTENHIKYVIENPVTIKRGQSSMVPFVHSRIDSKKRAVYNPKVHEKHPMIALMLKNSTGATLTGGPATVMEDREYAGEAILDTLIPGREVILPYRLEVGCTIMKKTSNEVKQNHRVTLKDAHIYFYYYETVITDYSVRNKTEKELTLILDHSFISDWVLEDKSALIEKTDNYYRFELKAASGLTTPFRVVEKCEKDKSVNVSTITGIQVKNWHRDGIIDERLRLELEGFITLYSDVDSLNFKLHDVESEINRLSIQQSRIGENLKTLNSTDDDSQMQDKLTKEKEECERALKKQKKSREELTDRISRLKQELKQKLDDTKYGRPGYYEWDCPHVNL